MEDGGWRWRMEDGGWRMEDRGLNICASYPQSSILYFSSSILYPQSSILCFSSILNPQSSILYFFPVRQMPGDVFDYHHRVIDDQADGNRQAAQRHQVECFTAPAQEEEGDGQGDGDGQSRDEGGPPAAQESQQDKDAEQTADQNGIAHVLDGGIHEDSLVIDNGGADIARQLVFGQQGANVARDVDGVASQPPKDGDHHRITPLVADRQRPVLVSDLDVGHVADPERLTVFVGDDQLFDQARRLALRVHDHVEGEGRALDPADRLEPVGFADAIGDVGSGQAMLIQVFGADFDFDLAEIAAGHVGSVHVRYVLDVGGELVVGVVAQLGQIGRRISTRQHQTQDGKDRRGHLLHGERGFGRELGADGADAVPRVCFGPANVRAGVEGDG